MAPRNRRSKVGLTRMHAALDAMRPIGFSTDVVRKSLKKLLKVYGDDGWAFIEEAAYKLLIDTILEEPEELQLDHEPKNLQLGGGEDGIYERQEFVHQLCDTEVNCDEQNQVGASSGFHETETHNEYVNNKQEESQQQDLAIVEVIPKEFVHDDKELDRAEQKQIGASLDFHETETHSENVNIRHKKPQQQDLAIVGVTPNTPMPSKAIDNGGRQVGLQLGFAPSYTPQTKDCTPTNRRSKPCYGWISDDEDEDDFLQLIPATSIDN